MVVEQTSRPTMACDFYRMKCKREKQGETLTFMFVDCKTAELLWFYYVVSTESVFKQA